MAGTCDAAVPAFVEVSPGHHVRCYLHSGRCGSERCLGRPGGACLCLSPRPQFSKETTDSLRQQRPAARCSRCATSRNTSPSSAVFLRRVAGYVKAVDDVSFSIYEGETFGAGRRERLAARRPWAVASCARFAPTAGEILLQIPAGEDGGAPARMVDLATLPRQELRSVRRHFHMIFQDPYSSLDPRMTVLDIIAEPLRENQLASGEALNERVKELMGVVGLEVQHLKRYPHAFSGGQRQRIGNRPLARPQPAASSSATKPSARSMSPSRRKSSTCCRIYSSNSTSPTFSSRMIYRWWSTFPTAWA